MKLAALICSYACAASYFGRELADVIPLNNEPGYTLGEPPSEVVFMSPEIVLNGHENGRILYNTTEESNICKSCIDDGFNFCPNAAKNMGYCCESYEQCPRASDGCSYDYSIQELRYMLCPNEVGCTFSR